MKKLIITTVFNFLLVITSFATEQPQVQIQVNTIQTTPAVLAVSKIKNICKNDVSPHDDKPSNKWALICSLISFFALLATVILFLVSYPYLMFVVLTLSMIFGIISIAQQERRVADMVLALLSIVVGSMLWVLFVIWYSIPN